MSPSSSPSFPSASHSSPSPQSTPAKPAGAQQEFDEMKRKLGELQALYKKHFPKVDPVLVEELVSNTDSSGDSKDRLYSLNVMAKEGTDPGRMRDYFLSRMGQAPTSLDGGRHYIVNVYPTLDMVKELQSLDAVEYIRGDYTFGTHAMHSAHLHRGPDEHRRIREA